MFQFKLKITIYCICMHTLVIQFANNNVAFFLIKPFAKIETTEALNRFLNQYHIEVLSHFVSLTRILLF